ncbi:hypothetical protein D3C71_555870 [compost metagenome]
MRREGELVLEAEKIGGEMQGREPHFGALQAGLLTIREGKTGALLPALRRAQDDGFGHCLRLGAHKIRLFQAKPERVDRIEQVAGGVAIAGKTFVIPVMGQNRIDCGLRMRNGQAELRVASACESIETVDRLEKPLLRSRPAPKAGGAVDMGGQPSEQNLSPPASPLATFEIARIEIERRRDAIDAIATAPGSVLPRQCVQPIT